MAPQRTTTTSASPPRPSQPQTLAELKAWLARPKPSPSSVAIADESMTALPSRGSSGEGVGSFTSLPALPFARDTWTELHQANLFDAAQEEAEFIGEVEATARPHDHVAAMSPLAQEALYEAARRRLEAQRFASAYRKSSVTVYSSGSQRSLVSEPEADDPAFDVVAALGTGDEAAEPTRQVEVSLTATHSPRKGVTEPCFDVVAFEDVIESESGHQTYIVMAPSSAVPHLAASARTSHAAAPAAKCSAPGRRPPFSDLYGKGAGSKQQGSMGSMQGILENEESRNDSIRLSSHDLLHPRESSMHSTDHGGKRRSSLLSECDEDDDASVFTHFTQVTTTKLKSLCKGLPHPKGRGHPPSKGNHGSKRKADKKPSMGSEGTASTASESPNTPRQSLSSSPSPLHAPSAEAAPPTIVTNTTRVTDLSWNDAAGKLHGLYSGPIDHNLKPHGEGTLKFEGTKFLFHGRWDHGVLVTPLLNDDEWRSQQPAAHVDNQWAGRGRYPCRISNGASVSPDTAGEDAPLTIQQQPRKTLTVHDFDMPKQPSPASSSPRSSDAKHGKGRYALGEVARTPKDMVIHRSNSKGIQAVSTLNKYDQAFLKRSNGLWTCAVLADRGMQPATSRHRWCTQAEIDEQMELEECMLFVINDDGATKIVKRRHWGKFVRCMQTEEPNA